MAFKRPDHPDFWLLSEIVIDQDTASFNETILFDDMVGQIVDTKSLAYLADQRALRILGPAATNRERAKIAAVFMDAFMVGAKFQTKKNERASE